MTVSRRDKMDALWSVIRYNPVQFLIVLCLSLGTAVFEGVGLGFLLPIIQQAGNGQLTVASDQGLISAFETGYSLFGIPSTFNTLLVGAAVVLGLRFGTAILVRYLRIRLVTEYVQSLKTDVFDKILAADLSYIDSRGSDELLNLLLTQTDYPANVLASLLSAAERCLLVGVYLALAVAIDPVLTGAAAVILIGITVGIRAGVGPAYTKGDEIANSNERMQSHAQSGIQGIRDVRLFGLSDEFSDKYAVSVQEYRSSIISLRLNQAIVSNLHRFAAAVTVLGLVYLALEWSALSLGAVGLFLFVMLRLAPNVSSLLSELYYLDGELPHLIDTLHERRLLKPTNVTVLEGQQAPETIEFIEMDDVAFHYSDDDSGITDMTLTFSRGELTAIVGESGAGKSTIISLLARLYEPDQGDIKINGSSLSSLELDAWRDKIAVIRQEPYIFNDTLRNNILLSQSNTDSETFQQAVENSRVKEFVDSLPNGYDTELGDNGVRLSGGQKQRVAIARALVRDPDVLLFDEATSDLDHSLEAKIFQAIQNASAERIVVVVSHRLVSITDADRIYTIKDGRVSESGNHAELVTANGPYAALYPSD